MKKTSKKKKLKKKKLTLNEIKPDQILLNDRSILLFDNINHKTAKDVISRLIALDKLNKKRIILRINSGGGTVADGIAIIDTIRLIESPVVTWVTGLAGSMAGLIAICGNFRVMTKDSALMLHPAMGGVNPDYFHMERDRMKLLDLREKALDEILKKRTKLTPKEIMKAKTGELWLNAQECLDKGIVDKII